MSTMKTIEARIESERVRVFHAQAVVQLAAMGVRRISGDEGVAQIVEHICTTTLALDSVDDLLSQIAEQMEFIQLDAREAEELGKTEAIRRLAATLRQLDRSEP